MINIIRGRNRKIANIIITIAVLLSVALLTRAYANTIAIGQNIVLTGKFRVMDANLTTGIGMQEANATGVVVGGPVKKGNQRWWRVDFGQGIDGWVVESLLSAAGKPSIAVTLTGTPTTIAPGESSTLAWTSQSATSCTASGDASFSGSRLLSGTVAVSPGQTTTYQIQCASASGSGTASVTINVTATGGPAVALTAMPSTIAPGGSSVLAWSAPNATSCTAAGDATFSGARPAMGSMTVQPAQSTAYALTCMIGGTSQTATATITVGAVASGGATAFTNPDNGDVPDRAKHPIAFPTAIGFGKNTSVRSKDAVVYKINSLEDVAAPGDGKITYRECALALAVTTPYAIPAGRPRYCVFDVAGAIVMQSSAFITTPKIYIAGQTSPGGIEFRLGDQYNPVDSLIDTRRGGNDMILRHVRTRTGPHVGRTSENGDPIRMSGTNNQILDHVSTMFGTDESLDMACTNCTVQWSIIGPNICRNAGHTSALHCKTFFLKPASNVTVAHNLSQHGEQRGLNIAVGTNPAATGNKGQADIINNVFYDFIAETGLLSNQFGNIYANYIGNVALRGPRYNASDGNYLIGFYSNGGSRMPFGFSVYASGNVTPRTRIAGQFGSTVTDPFTTAGGFITHVDPATVCGLTTAGSLDCARYGLAVMQNVSPVVQPGGAGTSFEPWQVTTAERAMLGVLAYAGADLCLNGPCRDNVDAMYVEDVRTCDATPYLFASNWPSSLAEAGGWARLTAQAALPDSDNDGMPDSWERRFKNTNPLVWDANDDKDGDGYPNIEEYLSSLAQDDVRYSGFIGSATGRLPAYNCGRPMY
ncbi:hypothetical protein KC8_08040 [Sphingomonas sp. KC8]|nr:hypothetical protein KC8_08040 [Sphingomonas sp. KC8]